MEQQISTVSKILLKEGGDNMKGVYFVLMCLIIVLALVIVLVVLLKSENGSFSLSAAQKKDALLVEVEHQEHIDK